MKKKICLVAIFGLLLVPNFLTPCGINLGNSTFNHLFDVNSPIFNLPLYFTRISKKQSHRPSNFKDQSTKTKKALHKKRSMRKPISSRTS